MFHTHTHTHKKLHIIQTIGIFHDGLKHDSASLSLGKFRRWPYRESQAVLTFCKKVGAEFAKGGRRQTAVQTNSARWLDRRISSFTVGCPIFWSGIKNELCHCRAQCPKLISDRHENRPHCPATCEFHFCIIAPAPDLGFLGFTSWVS